MAKKKNKNPFSLEGLEESFMARQNDAQIHDGVGTLADEEKKQKTVAPAEAMLDTDGAATATDVQPVEKADQTPAKNAQTATQTKKKPKKQPSDDRKEPIIVDKPQGPTIGVQVQVPVDKYQLMEQYRIQHMSERWTKQKIGLSAILEWVEKYCK